MYFYYINFQKTFPNIYIIAHWFSIIISRFRLDIDFNPCFLWRHITQNVLQAFIIVSPILAIIWLILIRIHGVHISMSDEWRYLTALCWTLDLPVTRNQKEYLVYILDQDMLMVLYCTVHDEFCNIMSMSVNRLKIICHLTRSDALSVYHVGH